MLKRYKILLDGDEVCNDKRGWYAVIGQRQAPEPVGLVWDCDVWHPKDSPNNPEDRSMACPLAAADTIEECLQALKDDGWLFANTELVEFPFPI